MDGNAAGLLIVALMAAGLVAAGYLLPHFTGGTYREAKWRLLGPVFIVLFIWIALTPNGCSMS